MAKAFLRIVALLLPLLYIIKSLFSAWTTPRTWSAAELVTAALMNTHVRDNLNALKDPPGSQVLKTSNFDTSSTSYVDVTDLSITFTSTGGDLFMSFDGFFILTSGTPTVELQFLVDAAASGTLARVGPGANGLPLGMRFRTTASAGSHTIKVQMKVDTGTGRCAAATSGAFFYAGEVT